MGLLPGPNINNYLLSDPNEALGVNTRADLALVYKLKNKPLEQHMENGVTIVDPD